MCESIIVVMCHVIALSDEVIIIGLLNEICISSLLLSISVLVVKSTYNWVSHYYGFNLEGYLLCYLITLYEWPFFQVFFPSLYSTSIVLSHREQSFSNQDTFNSGKYTSHIYSKTHHQRMCVYPSPSCHCSPLSSWWNQPTPHIFPL